MRQSTMWRTASKLMVFRDFAAWIGLVPREHSTGGKQKLLGISKVVIRLAILIGSADTGITNRQLTRSTMNFHVKKDSRKLLRNGAEKQNRTADLLRTKQALFHLGYFGFDLGADGRTRTCDDLLVGQTIWPLIYVRMERVVRLELTASRFGTLRSIHLSFTRTNLEPLPGLQPGSASLGPKSSLQLS
jgi:hypothetical protein